MQQGSDGTKGRVPEASLPESPTASFPHDNVTSKSSDSLLGNQPPLVFNNSMDVLIAHHHHHRPSDTLSGILQTDPDLCIWFPQVFFLFLLQK